MSNKIKQVELNHGEGEQEIETLKAVPSPGAGQENALVPAVLGLSKEEECLSSISRRNKDTGLTNSAVTLQRV